MAACGLAHGAETPTACTPVARVVSIQGALQIQRAGESTWSYVRGLDTILCQGDLLHTGSTSRAALLLSPETLFRVQQNSTVSIRQTPDETVVEYVISDIQQPARLAPNPCGAGYFINRFPKKFRVLTPFINASVEGTEFLVALSCQSATVAVFEGKVRAQQLLAADGTAFSLTDGEQVTVGGAEPAAVKLIVKPVDAVQWALYYAPLTQPVGEEAADQPCNQPDDVARGQCILQRAEERLRAGRVEEAEADLDALIAVASNSGEPYALRSIIRVTKNDKVEALTLAERAIQRSPDSSRAWTALSYAYQASFDLARALDAAGRAAQLAPGSSTALARLAELLMSTGRINDAERAARAAVQANPADARAYTVLGFVHLARIDTKAARQAFLAAIERDSSDPLSRLGLGLAIIRDGDLKAGREQIEVAAVLSPTNSLIRSYLGKAYFEENTAARDVLAQQQFRLAELLDPTDPTPWLYEANLLQMNNRPTDALSALEQYVQLNDNRMVYRSRLLLDEDAASRSSAMSRVYDRLGLSELAQVEASRSLTLDPVSYGAHQFLADAYLQASRHEIARASELLQAQMTQPINIVPVQPRLTITEFNLAPFGAAPSVGFNEYTSLFERDRIRLYANGVIGNLGTASDEVIATAVHQNVSVSMGQFHYQTDGFRENNDATHDALDLFLQVAVNPQANLQAELVHRRSRFGDISLNFDPEFFDPFQRREFEQDSARVGGRIGLCPQCDLLMSVAYVERTESQELTSPAVVVNDQADGIGHQAELQYVHRLETASVVGGLGVYDLDVQSNTTLDFSPSPCPPMVECQSSASGHQEQTNGYVYVNIAPRPALELTLGAGHDRYTSPGLELDQWSHKLGLLAKPTGNSTVRLASFRTVKRPLPLEQTLEPTQVAAFNQFFDDPNGTASIRNAAAFDARISSKVTIGAEVSSRHLEFPISFQAGTIFEDQDEESIAAFVNWRPNSRWVIGVNPRQDRFSRAAPNVDDRPTELRTRAVPTSIRYFSPSGITASAVVSYVEQRVERLASSTFPTGENSFWLVDGILSYQLERRRGAIGIEVRNLFDRKFNYQDDSFRTSNQTASPPYCPCRQVFLRVAINL
jgi:tetratricopeptide (TPR) repeat protein